MSDNKKSEQRVAGVDRDTIDVAVLATAFLAGIVGSIGLKMFDFSIWLPAFVTAAIIATYAIVTYNTRSARLEPDQIGDNAYYLGFVFTLTALGYTIYELDPGAEAATLREVVSGFGVALSSTIVGVATRVILLQYRVDLTAREGEVRFQLNEAAREFHTELADAIRGTKLLGTEIRQYLEEHHKEVAEVQEKRVSTLFDELQGAFKQSFEQIVDLGKELNKQLVDGTREAINESEEATGQTLRAVANQIEETSVALKSAMGSLAAEGQRVIENSAGMHSQNMAAHEQMMRESTSAIAFASDSLRSAVQRLANQSNELAETMARMQAETVQRQEVAMREGSERLTVATSGFVEKVAASLVEFEEQMAVAQKFGQIPKKRHGRWALWRGRSSKT